MATVAAVAANNAPNKKPFNVADFNMKSIKLMLLIITGLFLVLSVLMIVLGISVFLEYHDFSIFHTGIKHGGFLTPSVMTISVGVVLLVVTLIGFLGALKQSTCMINFYALFLTAILITKLVIVIMAFTVDLNTLMRYLYFPIPMFSADTEIEDEINKVQISLNCCGGTSFLDYMGMEWREDQNTTYIMKVVQDHLLVMVLPESCCIVRDNIRCVMLRERGCKEALATYLVENSQVLGILGVSVMVILLLGIIFALLLARCTRRLKSERALMEWKMKEQMILARQDASRVENEPTLFILQSESSVV